jgi:hypothetical protein
MMVEINLWLLLAALSFAYLMGYLMGEYTAAGRHIRDLEELRRMVER